jgi:hypothetical protein
MTYYFHCMHYDGTHVRSGTDSCCDVQCSDLVVARGRHYDPVRTKQLQHKLNNMHIFVHDLDGLDNAPHVPSLKRNTYYFPYKVNVAYTPLHSTRAAAIVGPQAAGGPQSWDFPTVKV